MRTIEVSDAVFQRLQSIAVPFTDTPSTVIERLLQGANGTPRKNPTTVEPSKETEPETEVVTPSDDGTYTFRRAVSYTFEGISNAVSSFKEIYMGVCAEIARRHPELFDRVLVMGGRKRAYFATSAAGLTHPQRVDGTNFYAETNFSAQNIVDLARKLLKAFGYSPTSLVIETRPLG